MLVSEGRFIIGQRFRKCLGRIVREVSGKVPAYLLAHAKQFFNVNFGQCGVAFARTKKLPKKKS